MKNLRDSFKEEIETLARSEKLFIFFCMLSLFSISAEYAITRPASTSIFLETFSSEGVPYVWLATVPLNLFIVYLYNRFLPRIGPIKMMGTLVLATAGFNALCALLLLRSPP